MFKQKRQGHFKNNVELSKVKREALNEKFLAHVKTNTRDKEQDHKEENREKQRIKEFQKQLRKAKKEIEEQKKLITDLKKENRTVSR
ncbi:hypothetical protein [Bacillus sp. Au-Bac7]|uniref:hypothetical protein n=1 Tax=Bacillus sp. Au-Bac7 TaxID=2906458 RepID=UPI001E600C82|nr:hypothetical protein [Bacillus sp. Au-Bac7]MCE4049916.1 hypothetical protein [Bacillus sp. Au-Bac7]